MFTTEPQSNKGNKIKVHRIFLEVGKFFLYYTNITRKEEEEEKEQELELEPEELEDM